MGAPDSTTTTSSSSELLGLVSPEDSPGETSSLEGGPDWRGEVEVDPDAVGPAGWGFLGGRIGGRDGSKLDMIKLG